MNLKIDKRKLREKEIDVLVEEIKKFPNPLTSKKAWGKLEQVYIVRSQTDLIGVCGVTKLKDWMQLGPFVVFQKYHRRGYGRKILETLVKDYQNANLFIGSRNPAVAKIALRLGFQETRTFWSLPMTIQRYLIGNILQSLSIGYLKEVIRKKPTQEGPYRFFLRKK